MKLHHFNRRKFLGSAVCCAAAVAASPSGFLIAGEPAGTKRRIRIGFLGATYSHAPGKLAVIFGSNDFELVGVCEESAAARQDCEKAGAKIISQDDLLARSEVVAVESAVRDHARHALLALKAGKHVHLEKPPAMTLDEFAEIVAITRERELLLQTGYMWRYNPGFTTILEAVRKGWLGKVFLVRANISNLLAPARRPDWADFKGGSLFELGSHLVDAVVRLLGKPKTVTPFLRGHGSASDKLKDNNVAVLEYDKAMAVITNNALQDTRLAQRSFEVLGFERHRGAPADRTARAQSRIGQCCRSLPERRADRTPAALRTIRSRFHRARRCGARGTEAFRQPGRGISRAGSAA